MKLPVNEIIQGDCLEVLPNFPPESIDLVIADFPYYISGNTANITKKGNRIVQGDFGEWDKSWATPDDYLEWVFRVFNELERIAISSASVIAFLDHKIAGWVGHELERRGLFVYKSPLIWVKRNPIPHIRKTGFRSTFEHAIWLIKSGESYFGNPKATVKPKTFNFLTQEEMTNVAFYNIGKKETTHPTEKPLDLTKRLVAVFSNEGEIVLDPFIGSGTTAVASKSLNRNWIGIELSKDYCQMSKDRLERIPQGLL